MKKLSLIIAGAGTVGYWTAKVFSESRLRGRIARITIADGSRIRPQNAVTCPGYARHAGRPKCERLAELARGWFGRRALRVSAVMGDVEELNWPGLLAADVQGGAALVIAGLDDWSSRLSVCGDIRAARGPRPPALLVQIGLDRDRAALAVLGTSPRDPCPACGLSFLPETEPCVLLDEKRRPARGDLRSEARAAARLAARVAVGLPTLPRRWLNTKTNLFRERGGRGFGRFTRPARRTDGCIGPHSRSRPVRWEGVLESLEGGTIR